MWYWCDSLAMIELIGAHWKWKGTPELSAWLQGRRTSAMAAEPVTLLERTTSWSCSRAGGAAVGGCVDPRSQHSRPWHPTIRLYLLCAKRNPLRVASTFTHVKDTLRFTSDTMCRAEGWWRSEQQTPNCIPQPFARRLSPSLRTSHNETLFLLLFPSSLFSTSHALWTQPHVLLPVMCKRKIHMQETQGDYQPPTVK